MEPSESDLHVSTASRDMNEPTFRGGAPSQQQTGDESNSTNNSRDGIASKKLSERDRRASIGQQARASQVNREFVMHRGRRKSYNQMARPMESARAMSFKARMWKDFKACLFCRSRNPRRVSDQYRIPPQDEFKFVPFQYISKLTEGSAVDWCLWHYRTGFTKSILAFLLNYIILIWLYALLIRGFNVALHSREGEQCLIGWDYESEEAFLANFNIAFELSWTTLSTVGFGAVSVPPEATCRGMRYILATEAFVGVLYIGFCGAIFYSKISRGLATAPVTFSSPICLQYGKERSKRACVVSLSGIASTSEDFEEQLEQIVEVLEENPEQLSEFPFLEFRVVNDRANVKGASIADATVNCMAISFRLLDKASQHRGSEVFIGLDFNEGENVQHEEPVRLQRTVDDVPNVKRTYRKVTLKHPKHPHFSNGAWYLKHTLDQSSPFLRGSIRRKLGVLGGWPTSWNNHEKIRTCLNPNIYEIGIIFRGMSTQNLVDVFKIQTWKPEDIYIGWQFVSTSYLDKRKSKRGGRRHWRVDHSLVHDIIPQTHGGNEPLGSRCPEVNIPRFLGKHHQLSEED